MIVEIIISLYLEAGEGSSRREDIGSDVSFRPVLS